MSRFYDWLLAVIVLGVLVSASLFVVGSNAATFWQWLEAARIFVALVGVIAWPIVALVVLVLFRQQLSAMSQRLTDRIGAVQVGNAKVDFYRTPDLALPITHGPEPETPRHSEGPVANAIMSPLATTLNELAVKSPEAAVTQAWTLVSGAAIEAVQRAGVVLPSGQTDFSPESVEAPLLDKGILSAGGLAVLQDMRKTFAVMAEGKNVSAARVAQYILRAITMYYELMAWKPK